MTVQEKRKRLERFCDDTNHCRGCILEKRGPIFDGCYNDGVPDEIINENYEIVLKSNGFNFLLDYEVSATNYQALAMRTNDGGCTQRLDAYIGGHYSKLPNRFDPGELFNGALGLTGEAGEVADMIKKHIFHGHDLDRDALIKELGDVCWYIALLCTAINVDMSEVMSRNIEKLKNRYPEGFSESASINRTE